MGTAGVHGCQIATLAFHCPWSIRTVLLFGFEAVWAQIFLPRILNKMVALGCHCLSLLARCHHRSCTHGHSSNENDTKRWPLKNRTANGAPSDTAHRPHQGVLYCHNAIPFHGTPVKAIPFTSTTKVRPSLSPFSRVSQMHNSILCRSAIPHFTINVGSAGTDAISILRLYGFHRADFHELVM